MIRPLFLFSLVAALSTMPLAARQLTPEQALERLKGESQPEGLMKISAERQQLAMTVVAPESELPMAYVFTSPRSGGYMVISADDVAIPLLGYTDSGVFDPDNIPDNLRWWLDNYAAEISAAASAPRLLSPGTARPQRKAISPMLTTRWSQSSPYNNMCPSVGGRSTMVGCVATAMAQVMNYHQWPAKATGTNSYTTSTYGVEIEHDFADDVFDWENMADVYDSNSTADQKEAIARLMYSAAVSVNMDFGPVASGAQTAEVAKALRTYFGYDESTFFAERTLYGITEWEQRIYDELVNVGPVLYSGVNSEGGHAFVCDGYSTDGFFHFNWGWEGISDGYFRLSALDPADQGIGGSSAGYNCAQAAIFGAQPAKAGSKPVYVMAREGLMEVPTRAVQLGSALTLKGGIWNIGDRDIPAGTSVSAGVWFVNSATSDTTYVESSTLSNYQRGIIVYNGFSSFSVTVPADLAEGDYVMIPNYTIDGDIRPLHSYTECYESGVVVTVADNKALFSESLPTATFSDVKVSGLYQNSSFQVSTVIENTGDGDFFMTLCPALINTAGQAYIFGFAQVELLPGESTQFKMTGTIDASLPAGNYKFYILDYNRCTYNQFFSYYGPMDVTLNEATGEDPVVKCNSLSASGYSVDGNATVTVSAEVECTAGYFADAVYAYLFKDGENIGGSKSEMLFLEVGQSAQTTFTVNLSATPGDYKLYLYSLNDDWKVLEGTKLTITSGSGVDTIDEDLTRVPVVYYNLQGIQVNSDCLQAGQVYIKRQGDKVTKIVAQ